MVRVLLIEPDWPLAQTVRNYLKSRGYGVRWQPDAEGGIQSADQIRPDVVLLQLQLPLHSGVEFLYEFRSYEDWVNIPVVMYGSVESHEVGSAESWQQLGISSYHRLGSGSLAELSSALSQATAASVSA